jgi:hypothetical protein
MRMTLLLLGLLGIISASHGMTDVIIPSDEPSSTSTPSSSSSTPSPIGEGSPSSPSSSSTHSHYPSAKMILDESSQSSQSSSSSSSGSGIRTMSNPVMGKLKSYQIVRPQQIMSVNEAIVEQLAPGDHPQTLSYRLQAFDKTFELQLEKNNELFSSDYQQIRLAYDPNDSSKAPTIERTPVVHCYYQGHVVGDPDSHVSMSTCNGLRGSITALGESLAVEPASYLPPSDSTSMPSQSLGGSGSGGGSGGVFSSQSMGVNIPSVSRRRLGSFQSYAHPQLNAHPLHAAFPLARIPNTDHVIFRQSDLQEEVKTCGVESPPAPSPGDNASSGSSSPSTNPPDAAIGEGITPILTVSGANPSLDLPSAPPSVSSSQQETIELLVFNDKSRWDSKGEATEADSLAIVNSVKDFYRSTVFNHPVRVVLVGQVTFSQGDPYQADMNPDGVAVEGERGLLQVFHRYRNQAANILPRHDSGQLFSERKFTSNIMGLAGVGSMCSEQSGSIACMTSSSLVKNAMIAAHETGHTLTMMHDGVYNTCPSGGYIMATTTGTATTFSSCSINSANGYFGSPNSQCLYNYAARQSPIQQRGDTSWLASVWSECSVTCGGGGIQVRDVECRSALGKVLTDVECNLNTKPKSVRVCNATVECDLCSVQNCSGRGHCQNGECLCPAGFAGKECEIIVPVVNSDTQSSKSSKSASEEQQVATSRMALALTGVLTGVAIACATILWVCRAVRRWKKDRAQSIKMLSPNVSLSTSPSLSDLKPLTGNDTLAPIHSSSSDHAISSSSSSSSGDAPACGPPSPCTLSSAMMKGTNEGHSSPPLNDEDSLPLTKLAPTAGGGVGTGSGQCSSSCPFSPRTQQCGLHKKTPRSIPRTIEVKQ